MGTESVTLCNLSVDFLKPWSILKPVTSPFVILVMCHDKDNKLASLIVKTLFILLICTDINLPNAFKLNKSKELVTKSKIFLWHFYYFWHSLYHSKNCSLNESTYSWSWYFAVIVPDI